MKCISYTTIRGMGLRNGEGKTEGNGGTYRGKGEWVKRKGGGVQREKGGGRERGNELREFKEEEEGRRDLKWEGRSEIKRDLGVGREGREMERGKRRLKGGREKYFFFSFLLFRGITTSSVSNTDADNDNNNNGDNNDI